jgi:hypothetical protein
VVGRQGGELAGYFAVACGARGSLDDGFEGAAVDQARFLGIEIASAGLDPKSKEPVTPEPVAGV